MEKESDIQSPITRLKHELAGVFDDKRGKKTWYRALNWFIIVLILLSSVEVFLSTFESLSGKIGGLLKFVDVFTTIFFSIEVALRIWTADLLDPKYKGFRGRIAYCLSFYGIIDILSTYPALLGLFFRIPAAFLKLFRIARILRIFRYMRSFRILGAAISSKKQELMISLMFLSILTIILSFLLYFAEHEVQPEECENGWKTLVWAFAKYLGDPGKVADFQLLTFWGNVIAMIVGVLGIAIFAVPAGLISSGFLEVIEEDRNKKRIADNIESIRHAFRWTKDTQHTKLYSVPAYRSFGTLLTKKFLPEADVVEAVKNSPNLHLYNLALAYNSQDAPADNVVVVSCAHNRPYGCCIDRGSKVTIVSTSGSEEPLTSWVAYHIAKIGGFNYVAKEIESNPDNPISYFNIEDEDACTNMRMFLDDIDRMSSQKDSWVIPMAFCIGPASREHKVHLSYSTVKGDESYDHPDRLFEDSATFDSFAVDFSKEMEDIYGIKTDKNLYYPINPKKNIMYHLKCKNGFAFRVECAPFYFGADRIAKIKTIADLMNRHFEPGVRKDLPEEMFDRPTECFGFEDYKD